MRRWLIAAVAVVLLVIAFQMDRGAKSGALPIASPCPSVTPTTPPGGLGVYCVYGWMTRDGEGRIYQPPPGFMASTPQSPSATADLLVPSGTRPECFVGEDPYVTGCRPIPTPFTPPQPTATSGCTSTGNISTCLTTLATVRAQQTATAIAQP